MRPGNFEESTFNGSTKKHLCRKTPKEIAVTPLELTPFVPLRGPGSSAPSTSRRAGSGPRLLICVMVVIISIYIISSCIIVTITIIVIIIIIITITIIIIIITIVIATIDCCGY